MAERLKLLLREIPSLRKNSIKRRRGMPLREHETIPVRLLRIFRVNIHDIEIEIYDTFCCRQ